MAQEADAPDDRAARRAAASEVEEDSTRLPRGSSPADTLISPRLWKHVTVALLAVLAWGMMLFVGMRADQARTGLHQIVGLQAGKIATFFSTVMLLTAGQLAFINLWYRSKSRKDFNGSYKVWFWTAVAWLTLCAFRATGAHWNVADAILAGRPVAIWNGRLITWMIPVGIAVVAVYRLLLREMRDCRASLWLLRLSGLAAFVSGLTQLFGSFCLPETLRLPVDVGAATMWHLLLALSMLLHARHVIHHSNEPPQSQIHHRSLHSLLSAVRWPRLRRPSRKRTSQLAESEADASTSAEKKTADRPKRTVAKKASRESTASKSTAVAASNDVKSPTTSTVSDSPLDELDEESVTDGSVVTASSVAPPQPQVRSAGTASTPATSRQGATAHRVDPPQPQAAPRPQSRSAPVASSAESRRAAEADDDDDDLDESQLSRQERKRLKKLNRHKSVAGR